MITGSIKPARAGIIVKLFDKSLKRKTFLEETNTDARGHFSFPLQSAKFPTHPIVGVFDPITGDELVESEPYYNAVYPLRVRLTIPAALQKAHGYDELVAAISLAVPQGQTVATLSDLELVHIAHIQGIKISDALRVPRAQRAEQHTGIPAAVCFVLLQKDIDISIPETLSRHRPADISRVLTRAVREKRLASTYTGRIPAILRSIESIALQESVTGDDVHHTTIKHILTGLGVSKQMHESFVTQYRKRKGKRLFWDELQKDTSFGVNGLSEKIRLSFNMLNASGGNLAVVTALQKEFKKKDFNTRSIASWDTTRWERTMKGVATPTCVPGTDEHERSKRFVKGMRRYAQSLFPTEAVRQHLVDTGDFKKNSKKKKRTHATAYKTFFEKNPNFTFGDGHIDSYLRSNPDALHGIEDVDTFTKDLKKQQRLFQVVPPSDISDAFDALNTMEIESAYAIQNMGWKRFSKAFTEHHQDTHTAQAIFSRTQNVVAASQVVMGSLAPNIDFGPMVTQGATPVSIVQNAEDDLLKDIPSLATLFGSLDFCECDHCRSVYSPAAYFADTMHFLADITVNEVDALTVKDALVARRPDLAHIKLNCENATTEMPYIDLVNEVLENAVIAHNGGSEPDWSTYQTTLTTEELKGNPEHQRDEAYTYVEQAVYPWNLPFSGSTEETRTYLKHLNVSRLDVLDAFTTDDSYAYLTDKEAIQELIGTHSKEYTIFVDAEPSEPWKYWGLSEEDVYTTYDIDGNQVEERLSWVDALARVHIFKDQSGLSFSEIEELVQIPYIRGGEDLSLNTLTCAIETSSFSGLSSAILNRIHRFVRLARRLNWTFLDLGKVITALGASEINEQFLQYVAQMIRIQSLVKKTHILTIAAWWGSIDTFVDTVEPYEQSLFDKIFMNKALHNPVDAALSLNEARTALSADGILSEHADSIMAALRITAEEFETLVSNLISDDVLSVESLTTLYRYSTLARALGMSVDNVIHLISISGAQPFNAAQPEQTTQFIIEASIISRSALSIDELRYIFAGTYDAADSIAPSDERIQVFLTDIRTELSKIYSETEVVSDPTGEITRAQLARVLDEDAFETMTTILNEVPADASQYTEFLSTWFSSIVPESEFAAFSENLLSPSDEQYTQAQVRYEYVQGYVASYLRVTQSQAIVSRYCAELMELNDSVTETLLSVYLTAPDDVGTMLAEMFLDDEFVQDTSDITRTTHERWFLAYIRLWKIGTLFTAWEVDENTLPLFCENGFVQRGDGFEGWHACVNPNTLPIAETTDAASLSAAFAGCVRTERFVSSLQKLPAQDDVSYADIIAAGFAPNAFATPYTDETVSTLLATVTGWDSAEVPALMSACELTVSSFADERVLTRLVMCHDVLTRLGVSVEKALLWTVPLDATAAAAAKNAAKARYEEDAWYPIAEQLRGVLRMKQRDALVGYLVAHQEGIDDVPDLYSYYLIDTEMSSCMLTSRIVQASAAVQQFVQRCLMNLESAVVIQESDYDGKWQHWKWMKNYRLWEANRKIFLYPENWLEPELRDDRSPFFKELEQELLQTDVNEDTVERVYLRYLEKLEQVSRLDIAAVHREEQEDKTILHVFGRTHGKPHVYYYRNKTIEPYGDTEIATWSAWEKISVDIEGDHVIPAVHENKLRLFWPIFIEKAESPDDLSEDSPDAPQKYYEIQIAWSEYKNGIWAQKSISDENLKYPEAGTAYLSNKGLYFLPRYADNELCIEVCETAGCEGGYCVAETKEVVPVSAYSYSAVGLFRFRDNRRVVVDTEAVDSFTIDTPDSSSLVSQRWQQGASSEYISSELNISSQVVLEETLDDPFIVTPLTIVRTGSDSLKLGGIVNSSYDPFSQFFFHENNRTFLVTRSGSADSSPMGGAFDVSDTIVGNYSSALSATGSATARSGAQIYTQASAGINKGSISSSVVGTDSDFSFTFEAFYHPYVADFIRNINTYGLEDGLLDPKVGSDAEYLRRQLPENNYLSDTYTVDSSVITAVPIEDIDFSYSGSYSIYNWELFYHIPVLIANQLSSNQQFETAQTWYQYVFDPTDVSEYSAPQKYWKIKPFHQLYETEGGLPAAIEELMELLNGENADMVAQVNDWKDDPFNPHTVATMRESAYMKYVAMKYIDNIIAWGDYLFRQDTREAIQEATQLYVLAGEILGKKPEELPKRSVGEYTFAELESIGMDSFSNAMVALEDSLSGYALAQNISASSVTELYPDAEIDSTVSVSEASSALATGKTLYFCIPKNERLLTYWDTVSDRLFKIRNCLNIDGVYRSLSLFAPPIDPGLLARASAAGVDIGSVMNDVYAPVPYYRFEYTIRRAVDMAQEVRSLGNALLNALEKKDAEQIALVRAGHEVSALEALSAIKDFAVSEAEHSLQSITYTLQSTEERHAYYRDVEKVSDKEQEHLDKTESAHTLQSAAQIIDLIASGMHLIPNFNLGAEGWASTPVVEAGYGGANIGNALSASSHALNFLASIDSHKANMAMIQAGHERRWDDWKLQERLAGFEIDQIKKQILGAEIRVAIAQQELANQKKQIEHSKEMQEYMQSKFTNYDLYSWMVSKIATLYFQTYNSAYDVAKKAERAFQFERSSSQSFIGYGYWDTLKKGLLAADQLVYDLKRMEQAYVDQNAREYEMTKHISLASLAPSALMTLKETGSCFFELPESLFDLDNPGHYLRRIKTVSISIPCVVGPYASMNATLTLTKHSTRTKNDVGSAYERLEGETDARFIDSYACVQSAALSHGQNDAGVFELSFKDERYLPFEGCGAVSTWKLTMPDEFRSFDYGTISDVIMHMRYTAREGGDTLKSAAVESLQTCIAAIEPDTCLQKVLSVRHEFPNEWSSFIYPREGSDHQLSLQLSAKHFPYMFSNKSITVQKVELLVRVKNPTAGNSVTILVGDDALALTAQSDALFGNQMYVSTPFELEISDTSTCTITVPRDGLSGQFTISSEDTTKLSPDEVDSIFCILHYTVE